MLPQQQHHARSPSELSVSEAAKQRRQDVRLLEHIFSQAGGKDLPLRTMFILNCASRGQPLAKVPENGSEGQFQSVLQTEISQLPLQRTSLPYSFVKKFVKETFGSKDVNAVNFSQALTALDYLKDIEMRRTKSIKDMWSRIDLDTWESIEEKVSRDEAVIKIFNDVNRLEKAADEMYAWLYVHLRQWILINEIKFQKFDKHNCMAMLNTLWPPIPSAVPAGVTPEIVQSQRKDFFKAINTMPKHNAELERLMMQNARAGEPNGWACVVYIFERYMKRVDSLIELSDDIKSRADLDAHAPPKHNVQEPPPSTPVESSQEVYSRKGRKVDSGVSFASNSSKRPSTSGSHSSASSFYKQEMSQTMSQFDFSEPKTPKAQRLRNAVSRIARKKRDEDAADGDKEKAKGLRKMRSLSTIARDFKDRNMSGTSLAGGSRHGSVAEPFDAEQMKRHRMAYESRIGQAI
ncbi:uncharacterized protein IWZ02DRAFT_492794 [Phyllosticta citriasiana]|uniref:Uncharacterized protein n=1 Tax=Phyllosticta citriasiana TaxID=595635 RepID=A0ABR1KF33_9PEZI